MRRGEIWFAATPGGDRPVLVLTRDPVADRIGSVVVAALTRTVRGIVSELELTPGADGVPSACVVNFDNIHTVRRDASVIIKLRKLANDAAFAASKPGRVASPQEAEIEQLRTGNARLSEALKELSVELRLTRGKVHLA